MYVTTSKDLAAKWNCFRGSCSSTNSTCFKLYLLYLSDKNSWLAFLNLIILILLWIVNGNFCDKTFCHFYLMSSSPYIVFIYLRILLMIPTIMRLILLFFSWLDSFIIIFTPILLPFFGNIKFFICLKSKINLPWFYTKFEMRRFTYYAKTTFQTLLSSCYKFCLGNNFFCIICYKILLPKSVT